MAGPELNDVGDLVLTDPRTMRVLADPFRLALIDQLRREGPAPAGALSAALEATPAFIEDHLRALEAVGLVALAGDAGWEAVGKGVVFEIPEDPEGQAAARQLSSAMLLHYVDEPKRWVADDEPRLELDWIRAAGMLNARVALTPDELRGVQEGIERLLVPYLTRGPDELPAEARRARILSYFLPEPADR